MAVGKWKATEVTAIYTGSTLSGHARVMDYCQKTLTAVANAIVGLGTGWSWNDTVSVLDDSSVIVGYGMAYTTLTYSNGTTLWIAFTGFGVPLHYKCFSQVRQGKNTAANTGSIFPALIDKNGTSFFVDDDGGGWQGGLLMSLLPAGLNESYGTPTITSPDWFPAHATPICGYYASFRDTPSMRTTSSTLTAPEHLYIINQDECFMVLVQSSPWAGATNGLDCTFCPRTQGYITGKIFEATNPNDNAPYSRFGWLCGNFSAYRNNAGNRTENWAWDCRYGEYANQCRAFYPYTLQSVTGSAGIGGSEAAYERGAMGWFTADGRRFNQCSGNTTYYLKGIGTGMGSYITGGFVSDQIETDPATIHFYPMIAGTNVMNKNWNSDTRSPTPTTAVKGIIRRDLALACEFKSTSENIYAQLPAHGAKLNGGNYIMGPSYMCFGWNPDYTKEETEELCAFRQHAKFYEDSYTEDIFGNDVRIKDMISDSTGVYIVAIDSSFHPHFAKLSLGVTTNPNTYTASDITVRTFLDAAALFISNSNLYVLLSLDSGSIGLYQVNTSTLVPSLMETISLPTGYRPEHVAVTQNRSGLYALTVSDPTNNASCDLIQVWNAGTFITEHVHEQVVNHNGAMSAKFPCAAILNNGGGDYIIADKTKVIRIDVNTGLAVWETSIADLDLGSPFIVNLLIDNADRIYLFGVTNLLLGKSFVIKLRADGTIVRTSFYGEEDPQTVEELVMFTSVYFNKNENRFHITSMGNSSSYCIMTMSLDGVLDRGPVIGHDIKGVIAENANDYGYSYNDSTSRAVYSILKRSWVS